MNQFPFNFDPSNFDGDFSFDPKKAGEIFTQLGNMISGLGGALQNPLNEDPRTSSTEIALKTCKSNLPEEDKISVSELKKVQQLMAIADTWLDGATILPASHLQPQAWNCDDWVINTLDQWINLCQPLAMRTYTVWSENIAEEQQQFSAMINDLTARISTFSLGNQLGNVLCTIAQESLTSTDSGLVMNMQGIPALLPRKINELAESLSISADELGYFLAVRESAHHRLHRYAPWLNPLLFTLIEQYAQAMSIDYNFLKEMLEGIDIQRLSDESVINEIISDHIVNVTATEEQEKLKQRIHNILALIEGWVEVIVHNAISDRLPSSGIIEEVLHRRRASGTGADQALVNLIGIELRPSKIRESAKLFTKIGEDLSIEQRDKIWAHPDLIPHDDEIDNISAFINRLLDSQEEDSLDQALRAMLSAEDSKDE